MSGARRAAEARGRRAERRAIWLLRLKGYRILAARLRTPAGEIDVLARRGRLVAVVEVKARASLAEALEAVSPRQQQRIATAAEWAIAQDPRLDGCDIRFDVVAIVPGTWPRHLQNAWMQA